MGPFHTAPDPMETTVRTAAHPDVFADRHLGPTEAERAAYDAIGESDRMTLRFRKPE